MILDKIADEIKELQGYKAKCKHIEKDKKEMSELLYKYMINDYNSKTQRERIEEFKKEWCRCCRMVSNDNCELYPANVGEPIFDDANNWIPAKTGCSKFSWK